jgi:methionyl-tRNA formyltransferase
MHTETGVSIMLLDAAMDHGPIIAQEKYPSSWVLTDPPKGSLLEDALAHQGGKLLAKILPEWIAGRIHSHEQNHEAATFCNKISKEDGHIDLSGDPLINIAKIRAYDAWPGTFFFMKHGEREIRIRITEAHIESDKLVLDRVIPEGKKEMNHRDFLRGIK